MKKIQVTLKCATGKYKPVSTIIEVPSIAGYNKRKKEYDDKAITKICQSRLWSAEDLVRFGYTKKVVREWDPEKIAKENAERYEQIKQEKYASGEWQEPKKK